MNFDWTITLGNFVSIMTFVTMGLFFIYDIKSNVKMLSEKVAELDKDLTKIDRTLEQVVKLFELFGRQEERMSALDRRLNDLTNWVHRSENSRSGDF